MSSLRRWFLPFNNFSPDSPEFGAQVVKKATNLLPVYGTYRPLRKLETISTQASASPPLGGIVHLSTQASSLVFMRPDADVLGTGWFQDDGKTGTNLYSKVDDFEPDFTDYIVQVDDLDQPVKIGLTEPEFDPTVNTGHVLKVGYRVLNATGSWDFDIKIKGSNGTITHNVSGAGVTAWEIESWAISTADVDTLVGTVTPDYTGLQVEIDLNSVTVDETRVQLSPNSDKSVDGWENELGVSLGVLYSSIDDVSPDDDEYVVSPPISVGDSVEGSWEFPAVSTGTEIVPGDTAVDFTYRYKATSSGVDLKVTLKQTDDAGVVTEIATETLTNIATTATTRTWTLTSAETALIDWSLKIEAVFKFIGTASSSGVYRPSADLYRVGWVNELASTSNMYDSINDSTINDSTYIETSSSTNAYYCNLDPSVSPSGFTGFTVSIKALAQLGGSSALTVILTDASNSLLGSKSHTVTATGGTYTFTTGPVVADFSTLEVRLLMTSGSGVRVSDINVQANSSGGSTGGAQGYIYNALVDGPVYSNLQAGWIRMEAPSPKQEVTGDFIKCYVGTETAIWEVDVSTGEWTDRTRSSGAYGSATDKPKLWRFAEWGDWVVATNYIDPVQVLKPGDTEFSDLIQDSDPPDTKQPKSKFVATGGSQLFLGSINSASWSDGKPFTVWVSGNADPELFKESDSNTQSVFFQLVQNMGEITGLVGGEYVLVFKRSSIYRAVYEGLPRVWRYDQVSIAEGCAYPRSIISSENDVYFWGSRGIFAIRNGLNIENVSSGTIEKFIFDFLGDEPVHPFDSLDPNVNDSMAFGARDPYSGLLWWFYRSPGEPDYAANKWVVYNPVEKRWSYGEKPYTPITTLPRGYQGYKLTLALAHASPVSRDQYLTRDLLLFSHDPDGDLAHFQKFDGDKTYEGELEIETITSAQFPGGVTGRDVTVEGMRLIYKLDPEDATPPAFVLSLTGGHDPQVEQNTTTRTVTMGESETDKQDNWIRFRPVTGEFFKLTVTIPELNSQDVSINEIVGVQFLYKVSGDY